MNTKRYLALVMALVMAFSLVVPVSAAPTVELLAPGDTDTARLTVNVGNVTAAVGSIDTSMNAKLVLNYNEYSGNSTVTVAGQTKKYANQTTFTLNVSNNSGINLNGSYFPGFGLLGDSTEYAIKFVDELGTSSKDWDYTFKKSADTTSGVTLELVAGNSQEADDRWQALKGEAFTNTDQTSDDSYIKLAAGSYIQLDTEKLTVNGELKLDNFSDSDHVDANVTNAKAKLTYTTASSGAYQLLLKKGTQFVLGHSIAEVKQDLLVTMTNVTKGYEGNILKDVYYNLATNTEQALAENLLKVFSEIAGLARPYDTTDNKPVVITFGTPTTSTNSTNTTPTGTGSETVEKTTTTIVTNNDAGTTNTTTVATENTTTVNTSTNTTTVVSTVTETSSAVQKTLSSSEQLTYEVTYSGQVTTTTTQYENGVQTNINEKKDTIEETNKTVTITAVAEDSSKVLDAIGKKAKVGTPLLNNVADDALAAIVTEAVTAAQTDQSVDSISVKIVIEAEAKNADNADVKTYEVTPKAYTYVNEGTTPTSVVEISNENLASNAQFTITLPVPDALAGTKKVTVTHTSDDYPKETFITDVLGTAGKYYVTFQTSHFSVFSISANSSVSHEGKFTFENAYNSGYNFVDTVYLNAQDTIYMNIVVFVNDHFNKPADGRNDGKCIHVTYAGTDLDVNITLSDIPVMSAAQANDVEKDMKTALVFPGYWCYCDKITSTGNSNGFYTIRIPVYPNHMGKVMTVSLFDGNNQMTLYQNAGTSVFTNTGVTFGQADGVDLYTVQGNVYQQTTYNYLNWLKNNGSVEYQNIANAMIAYGQAAANIPQWNSSN